MSDVPASVGPVLEHLRCNPRVFGEACEAVSGIRVLKADRRKRYTDFYRLEVGLRRAGGEVAEDKFWVRSVKNKPAAVALAALEMQKGAMERLGAYLDDHPLPGVRLGCSRVTCLLPEYLTLVTRECAGVLLNRYLVRRLPVFQLTDTLQKMHDCGVWLRAFHECFRRGGEGDGGGVSSCNGSGPAAARGGFPTHCHMDFSPRNIFVGCGAVEVIDFVGMEAGCSGRDVGFFCNYITRARFNGLYAAKVKVRLVDAFLSGYASAEDWIEKRDHPGAG